MFAPPVKAPKAKAASQPFPTRAPKPPQHMPLRPGAGLSNQAVLRLLRYEAQRAESVTRRTSASYQAQEADRGRMASSEAVRIASSNFRTVPVVAPDQAGRAQ